MSDESRICDRCRLPMSEHPTRVLRIYGIDGGSVMSMAPIDCTGVIWTAAERVAAAADGERRAERGRHWRRLAHGIEDRFPPEDA